MTFLQVETQPAATQQNDTRETGLACAFQYLDLSFRLGDRNRYQAGTKTMRPEFVEAFDQFSLLLQNDIERIVSASSEAEGERYGFALAVPEDWHEPLLMYALGCESNLEGEDPKSKYWISKRYDPVEWVQNWNPIGPSADKLEEIYNRFENEVVRKAWSEARQQQEAGKFHRYCLNTCRKTLLRCDQQKLFGGIWYKVLYMHDGEHPVLVEAFQQLNPPKVRIKCQYLFPGMAQRFLARIVATLRPIRARWVRWRIGAKR